MSNKSFLKSMTIQGSALTALGFGGWGAPLATVLNLVGVPIEPTEAAQALDASSQIVGIVMTVIGRWRTGGLRVL